MCLKIHVFIHVMVQTHIINLCSVRLEQSQKQSRHDNGGNSRSNPTLTCTVFLSSLSFNLGLSPFSTLILSTSSFEDDQII